MFFVVIVSNLLNAKMPDKKKITAHENYLKRTEINN